MTVLYSIPNGASGKDVRDTMNALLFEGGARIAPHPENGWNYDRYPVKAMMTRRGNFYTDFDPKRDLPDIKAIFDGVLLGTTAIYYADIDKADDAGNGTSAATAKKTIAACLRLAEADGTKTASITYARRGFYPAKFALMTNGSGGFTIPTKPFAVIGYGGVVNITMAMETSGWALDAADGAGKTYKWVRANTRWVLDRLNKDKNDDFVKPPRVANAAAVYAASGSAYTFDAATNTIYLKWADGRVPSVDNTIVILNGDVFRSHGVAMYASGIEFVGGQAGTVQCNSVSGATFNVAAEDCGFHCAGHDYESPQATQANLVSADMQGIVVLNRCTGSRVAGDFANPHGFNVTAADKRCHILAINCRGWDVGAATVGSCNLVTSHGNDVADPQSGTFEYGTRVMAFMFGGKDSGGGMVGFSGGHVTLYGGTFDGDRGSQFTGPSTAIGLGNKARLFAYDVATPRCEVSLSVEGDAIAYVQNLQSSGGRIVTTGAGKIVSI